jgi:hypothetical protein
VVPRQEDRDGIRRVQPKPEDDLTPAEKKLLERVAERLIEEHSETLKKLGDE